MLASDFIKLWNRGLLVKYLMLNKREKEQIAHGCVLTKYLFAAFERDRAGYVALTLRIYLIGPLFKYGQEKLAILTTVFRALPQFLR